MSEIIDFINENIKEIIIIITVVLFLLVIINIKGLNLNQPKPNSKLIQEVTVEKFSNILENENGDKLLNSSENFCESYLGKSESLEKACNQLTKDNCVNVSCCVYGNNKCVAGDKNGPTYRTDKDGKLITMDSYYYLNKCYGKSC
jgi:hypothetical protein